MYRSCQGHTVTFDIRLARTPLDGLGAQDYGGDQQNVRPPHMLLVAGTLWVGFGHNLGQALVVEGGYSEGCAHGARSSCGVHGHSMYRTAQTPAPCPIKVSFVLFIVRQEVFNRFRSHVGGLRSVHHRPFRQHIVFQVPSTAKPPNMLK